MDLSYRAEWEIYNDLLDAVSRTNITTYIMHDANLSVGQLKRYSTKMQRLGLLIVNEDGRKKTYEITNKGKKFQTKFRGLISLVR